MKHFSEEELIAYQLHESHNESAISRHLESCSDCADLSESIAETLRVFSADPVPQPDLEHNWQRLRGNLSVLTPGEADEQRPAARAGALGLCRHRHARLGGRRRRRSGAGRDRPERSGAARGIGKPPPHPSRSRPNAARPRSLLSASATSARETASIHSSSVSSSFFSAIPRTTVRRAVG